MILKSVACAALLAAAVPALAETPWDVSLPRGEVREIDFTTREGTWMSLDLSPGGKWIVFDLLGHIYRLPATGGEAECLTQASGVALNIHPRFSPDGGHIAFVSDRGGHPHLWVMNADGSDPRHIPTDPRYRLLQPAWSPDGKHLFARRWDGLYRISLEGNEEKLVEAPAEWPSPSRDGRFLYFYALRPIQDSNEIRGDLARTAPWSSRACTARASSASTATSAPSPSASSPTCWSWRRTRWTTFATPRACAGS